MTSRYCLPVTEFGLLFSWNVIRTADPPGNVTGLMLCNAKASSLFCRAGTSTDLALETVGAEDADIQAAEMEFSALLNVTLVEVDCRAQPSGTLNDKPPAFAE